MKGAAVGAAAGAVRGKSGSKAAKKGAGVGVIAAAGRNSRNRREASANASAQTDQIVKLYGRARLQRSELIQRLGLPCECAGRIIAPANRVKSCSVEPGRSADRTLQPA